MSLRDSRVLRLHRSSRSRSHGLVSNTHAIQCSGTRTRRKGKRAKKMSDERTEGPRKELSITRERRARQATCCAPVIDMHLSALWPRGTLTLLRRCLPTALINHRIVFPQSSALSAQSRVIMLFRDLSLTFSLLREWRSRSALDINLFRAAAIHGGPRIHGLPARSFCAQVA